MTARDDVLHALPGLVADFLGELAFAYVQPAAASFAGWDSAELFWTAIELRAPRADHLTVAMPASLARQLAEDAWGGLPEEGADEAVADFLGELSNTLAGQLLAGLHPGEAIALGLPETGQGPRSAPAGGALTFDVEGHPLCVTLKSAA